MSEKFGNLTTTSIDPNKFGGNSGGGSDNINSSNPNNSPSFFEGNEISISIEEIDGMIAVNEAHYAESGRDVTQKYKVGDIYFNIDEQRSYQCIYTSFDGTKVDKIFIHRWIPLGGTEILYNSASLNPQSGIAVAEAIEYKADREIEQYALNVVGSFDVDDIGYSAFQSIELGTLGHTDSPDDDGYMLYFIKYGESNERRIDVLNPHADILRLQPNTKIKIEQVVDRVYLYTIKDVTDKADKSAIGDIETALDEIIALQNSILGGE